MESRSVPIDKMSFLVGFVLGLAAAAAILSGFVILAPRTPYAGAAAPLPTATATLALPVAQLPPTPSSTTTPSPSPTPTATPEPSPTPTAVPTATPVPVSYEMIDVPARRFALVRLPAEKGQVLEISVQLESDVELTLLDPQGKVVVGPIKVKKSHSFTHLSTESGTWVLKIDNSFSRLTAKQVLLQYRVLPAGA